ncbi:hypothetical protein HispidOSU_030246 [Sigmodon hispidus]
MAGARQRAFIVTLPQRAEGSGEVRQHEALVSRQRQCIPLLRRLQGAHSKEPIRGGLPSAQERIGWKRRLITNRRRGELGGTGSGRGEREAAAAGILKDAELAAEQRRSAVRSPGLTDPGVRFCERRR